MPFICMIREDIPDGTLQVLDLLPNTSQRNLIYDPAGQTKYVDRLQNDAITVTGGATAAEYKGVTAYILDSVANGTDGHALTKAQATSMGTAVIALLDAGTAPTLVNINAALAGVVAATELVGNGSSGVLTELLKIFAGGEYVVPAGTAAVSGAAFKGTQAGAFTTGQYRATYNGFPLAISCGEGHLSQFAASTYEYGGAAGAAVVVVDDDGSLLT